MNERQRNGAKRRGVASEERRARHRRRSHARNQRLMPRHGRLNVACCLGAKGATRPEATRPSEQPRSEAPYHQNLNELKSHPKGKPAPCRSTAERSNYVRRAEVEPDNGLKPARKVLRPRIEIVCAERKLRAHLLRKLEELRARKRRLCLYFDGDAFLHALRDHRAHAPFGPETVVFRRDRRRQIGRIRVDGYRFIDL